MRRVLVTIALCSAVTALAQIKTLPSPVTVVVLPVQTRSVGKTNFAALDVPLDMTSVTLSLDRADLTTKIVTTTVEWKIERSFDGGVTWEDGGAATTTNEEAISLDPTDPILPEPRSSFTVNVPQPSNPNRKIRGYLQHDRGTLTADLTVEFFAEAK